MKLSDHIKKIVSIGQSFTDIHIESDMPIMLRITFGEWVEYRGADGEPVVIPHSDILAFVNGIYTGKEDIRSDERKLWKAALESTGALHPAVTISYAGPDGEIDVVSRLRCSIQRQSMGESLAIVIRPLPEIPGSIEELGLPIQMSQLAATATQGLIVVTGATGSGKSTTIAAIVEHINQTRPVNILTIEDPIEYVYTRKKAIINQRELHVDCPSFEAGIRDALRFVPEVIVVGEIRDSPTMHSTLRVAEAGHLVLTSMHAPTTAGAIRKMVSLLDGNPADVQVLSSSLVAVIAQALVRALDSQKKGPRANELAYEFLGAKDKQVSALLQDIWKDESRLVQIEEMLRSGRIPGGKSMTDVLRKLVAEKRIERCRAALVCPYAEDRQGLLEMTA